MEIAREIGNKRSEANRLNNVAIVYSKLSEFSEAQRFHAKAVRIAKDIGTKDGDVIGTLTVDSKSTQLKYVYAWYESDPFDDTKQVLMLVFSDKAIPKETDLAWDLPALGRDGKINAIGFGYSLDQKNIAGGNFYHKNFGDMTVGWGGGNRVKSDLLILDDGTVEGEIHTNSPQVSMDVTWEVNVKFKGSIKK